MKPNPVRTLGTGALLLFLSLGLVSGSTRNNALARISNYQQWTSVSQIPPPEGVVLNSTSLGG